MTFSINKSDAVTSVSQSLKEDTKRLFITKKDITVIPNFIDLDKYTPTTKTVNVICWHAYERVITHISNFRSVKRIPDVIHIFHAIQKEIPSKLMMIGEGPEREKAEKLCTELNIGNKVVFLVIAMRSTKFYVLAIYFFCPQKRKVLDYLLWKLWLLEYLLFPVILVDYLK